MHIMAFVRFTYCLWCRRCNFYFKNFMTVLLIRQITCTLILFIILMLEFYNRLFSTLLITVSLMHYGKLIDIMKLLWFGLKEEGRGFMTSIKHFPFCLT